MRAKKSLICLIAVGLFIEITAQNKTVTIDQKLSTGDRVGTLKKWNVNVWSDPFNPGSTFSFPIYSTQTILGDQTIQLNQKYNNWNSDFTDVKNHHPFTIAPTTETLLSNFISTHTGVTIKTKLEGLDLTGGEVIFKDPWFIDYPDGEYNGQLRNRGMDEAVPHQRISPFYPNSTTPYNGLYYNGVFLDQSGPGSNWAGTFYKVGVPSEQTISVHGQNRKFYFQEWSASLDDYNQPTAQIKNYFFLETGIVFKDADAEVNANLKGQLMSNTTNGISSASQRKIVRTDNGRYHIVYESNGHVYYTYSLTSNFTGSWQKDEAIEHNAKNPSIDYFGNIVSIVCEYLAGPVVKIRYVEIDASNGSLSHEKEFDISSNANDFGIVKPVVSSIISQRLIVYKQSQNSNLKYRTRSYTQTWDWNSSPQDIPETDQYSVNPAVVGNKNLPEHHIVWQQGNYSIKYVHADYSGNLLRFCQDRDVSENSGFSTNHNPSVSVSYDIPHHKVQVSWQGIYKTVLEKGTKKVQDYSLYRYEAVTRLKVGPDSWGTKRNFGSNVNYVQSGSLNSTNGAVIAWLRVMVIIPNMLNVEQIQIMMLQ